MFRFVLFCYAKVTYLTLWSVRPNRLTWSCLISHCTISKDVILHHVISYYITSFHNIRRDLLLRHVMSCHVMWCDVMSNIISSYHLTYWSQLIIIVSSKKKNDGAQVSCYSTSRIELCSPFLSYLPLYSLLPYSSLLLQLYQSITHSLTHSMNQSALTFTIIKGAALEGQAVWRGYHHAARHRCVDQLRGRVCLSVCVNSWV